jgi:hypothetical protein
MFDSIFGNESPVDQLESDLVQWEAIVSLARARQADLLRRLDVAQVAAADGARTMVDWTAARLDIHHDTARQLVHAAHSLPEHPSIATALAAGEVTLDRSLATIKLVASGASGDLVETGAGFDLGGVERLAARHRRITRSDERQIFADRYWASQHSFDQGRARFWGELPGHDLELVEKALQERADALPPTPAEVCDRRPQRMVDALVAMSLDTVDPPLLPDPGEYAGPGAPGTTHRRPLATVFVDAHLAAVTDGEAGAELEFGPRVGPDLLDSILCEGATCWSRSCIRASICPPACWLFAISLRSCGAVVMTALRSARWSGFAPPPVPVSPMPYRAKPK